MKYCGECSRLVPGKKNICSNCGSSGIKEFVIENREKEETDGIKIYTRKIILNSKEYRINGILGTGGYGIILNVSSPENNRVYALKLPLLFKNLFTDNGNYSEEELKSSEESMDSEISVFKNLQGGRVLRVEDKGKCICEHGDFKCEFNGILLEYAQGTLKDLILMESTGKIKISFDEKIEIAGQIIEDLKFLHDRNVVHRDIALENIFIVDRDTRIDFVLGDFGTSKVRSYNKGTSSTKVIGKEKYLDPARFNKKYRSDPRIDMFTAGIVITEVFIGDLWDNIIYESLSEMNFEEDFLKNFVSTHLDKRIIKFIAKSLKPEIERRYRNTDEMKRKFEKIVRARKGKKHLLKIKKDIKIIYNIKIPLHEDIVLKEKSVDYENHSKLSFDSNEKLIINFRGVRIFKISLRKTGFVKILQKENSIELSVDIALLKRKIRIFLMEDYKKDKGILYFQNSLKVVYGIGFKQRRRSL